MSPVCLCVSVVKHCSAYAHIHRVLIFIIYINALCRASFGCLIRQGYLSSCLFCVVQDGEAPEAFSCEGHGRAAALDSPERYATFTHQRSHNEVNLTLTAVKYLQFRQSLCKSRLEFFRARCPPKDYSRERGKAPKPIVFEEDRLYNSLVARVPSVGS